MVGVNTMIISYQNAEIFTHIKGRLLERAVILINCVPFQNSNFSESKEFAPSGSEFSSLRRVPYGMEIQYYHIRRFPLNVYNFYYARAYLRNGSYANGKRCILVGNAICGLIRSLCCRD